YELVREFDSRNSRDGEVSSAAGGEGLAKAGDLERITNMLLQALHASGFVHLGTEVSTEEKLRRMILRLNLRSGDASALQGMLGKIVWKLERQKSEMQKSGTRKPEQKE